MSGERVKLPPDFKPLPGLHHFRMGVDDRDDCRAPGVTDGDGSPLADYQSPKVANGLQRAYFGPSARLPQRRGNVDRHRLGAGASAQAHREEYHGKLDQAVWSILVLSGRHRLTFRLGFG